MRLAGTVALAVLATTGCSPTKPGPVVELAIRSVSPSAGPAMGGTEVTIRGAGYAAGTTVTIGGRAATDVSVRGSDTLTAKTPASSTAGAVDVVVTFSGRTDVLAGGFTYEPTGPNTAPVIKSIAAQGRRLKQPPAFADYGETILLTVVVEDAESAATQLVYQWRGCDGTFSGTGPQVEWTAPALGSLPSTCTIEVAVLDGPHVLTRSIAIRLHNSIAEVGALALLFLEEFANSAIPAETTIRNFSDVPNECRLGKAAELGDVQRNRTNYRHLSHTYGSTTVTINFGGICAFRTRSADACIATPVEWRSTKLDTETLEVAKGTSQITGVYESSRWWLCRSEIQDPITTSGLTFMY